MIRHAKTLRKSAKIFFIEADFASPIFNLVRFAEKKCVWIARFVAEIRLFFTASTAFSLLLNCNFYLQLLLTYCFRLLIFILTTQLRVLAFIMVAIRALLAGEKQHLQGQIE